MKHAEKPPDSGAFFIFVQMRTFSEADQSALHGIIDQLLRSVAGPFTMGILTDPTIFDHEQLKFLKVNHNEVQKYLLHESDYVRHLQGYEYVLTERGHERALLLKRSIIFSSANSEITDQNRDLLITKLLESLPVNSHLSVPESEAVKSTGLSPHTIDAVFAQLHRMHLIQYEGRGFGSFTFILHAELLDFQRAGGFTVRNQVIIKSLQDILREIEVAKKEDTPTLDLFEKLTSIASNAIQFLNIVSQ